MILHGTRQMKKTLPVKVILASSSNSLRGVVVISKAMSFTGKLVNAFYCGASPCNTRIQVLCLPPLSLGDITFTFCI